jgi:hypothetical protein
MPQAFEDDRSGAENVGSDRERRASLAVLGGHPRGTEKSLAKRSRAGSNRSL